MSKKAFAIKLEAHTPPEGGRTFSNSRNPQQSKALATQPCTSATERCTNGTDSGGEFSGSLYPDRSSAADEALRLLYTLRCRRDCDVFVREIAGIVIARIELSRSTHPDNAHARTPDFMRETHRIIARELAAALSREREGVLTGGQQQEG